jgi:Helix-turn-helix domain
MSQTETSNHIDIKTAVIAVVLLAPSEVAKILGTTEGTLAVWRCTRRYPLPFVRVGRKIRYDLASVEQFIRSRTVGGELQQGHTARRRNSEVRAAPLKPHKD